MMNLSEVKVMIDQMAKLKMNYLEVYWFEHEPWINFGYRGENKLLGDATTKETGYMAWRYHWGSHLVKDLPVGQDKFDGRTRMAPIEFHSVETPEDGFRVAKDFLTETIRHCHARKIEVWLSVEPSVLPGNLARFATRAPNFSLPFSRIHAVHMCPGDPALHEINENRLRSLVETYPEADGYMLYITENYPDCRGELDRNLLLGERPKYLDLLKSWRAHYNNEYERNPGVLLDSTAGSLYVIKKMLEARDRIAPNTKIGIGGIGRGFILPLIDKMFPKDVPVSDMESVLWTPAGIPMYLFGGMGDRIRTLIPRLDDDASMFGMQFNVNLYDKDRVLEDSVKYGLAGFVGQLNRPRGMEQNYRYLAEGAYNPGLRPREFYGSYARRLFGPAAASAMVKAFEALEANEEYLDWNGGYNFGCCGPIEEIGVAYQFYKQPNPFDGPRNWFRFISDSHEVIRRYERAVVYLGEALAAMTAAEPQVTSSGREEFGYLRNKTESYQMFFQTLITARRAYLELEKAFRVRGKVDRAEFVRNLDTALNLFGQARMHGRKTAEHFAEVIDHPSDMGVLYRANINLVIGLELAEQTVERVVNFHHGRPYTVPVAWDKIYQEFPVSGSSADTAN